MTFFNKYKHFIVLSATADEPGAYKKWTGLVESNIRKLVNDLEKNEYILIAHVNTEAVELPPEPPGHSPRFISRWFLGLSFFKTEVQPSINLTADIQKFTDLVHQHSMSHGTFTEDMRVEAKYVKRRNLIPFLTPELAKTIKISKKSDVKKRAAQNGAQATKEVEKPKAEVTKSETDSNIERVSCPSVTMPKDMKVTVATKGHLSERTVNPSGESENNENSSENGSERNNQIVEGNKRDSLKRPLSPIEGEEQVSRAKVKRDQTPDLPDGSPSARPQSISLANKSIQLKFAQ